MPTDHELTTGYPPYFGNEENQDDPREITPEEIEQIKIEIDAIKWIIAGNVPVEWHDSNDLSMPGNFWSFDTDKYGPLGKVFLSNKMLDKEPGYAQAVSAHEFSHVAIEDMTVFSQDEMSTPGFLLGYNFAGDNAVEYYAMQMYAKGRAYEEIKARHDLSAGGGLLSPESVEILKQDLGYCPKHVQLGAMIRHYYYVTEVFHNLLKDKNPSNLVDPNALDQFIEESPYADAVKDTFRKIQKQGLIEAIYTSVPHFGAKDSHKSQVAEQRAQKYREMWEYYKEVVEKSYQEQQLIELIKKLIQLSQNGSGIETQMEEDQEVVIVSLDDFPESIKEEILQAFEEAKQQNNDVQDSQSKKNPQEGQTQSEPDDQLDQGNSAGQASNVEKSSKPSGSSMQSPLDNLSPEAKEAIEQVYNASTTEEKETMAQTAQQTIGRTEDNLNKMMQAQTDKEGATAESKIGESQPRESSQDTEDTNEEFKDHSHPESSSSDQSDADGDESNSSESSSSSQSQPSPHQPTNSTQNPASHNFNPNLRQIRQAIELASKNLEGEKPQTRPSIAGLLEPQQIQQLRENFDEFVKLNPQIDDLAISISGPLWKALRPDQKKRKRIVPFDGGKIDTKYYLTERLKKGIWFGKKEEQPQQTSVGISYIIDLSDSTRYPASSNYTPQNGRISSSEWLADTVLEKEVLSIIPLIMAQAKLRVRTELHGFGLHHEYRNQKSKCYIRAEDLQFVRAGELPDNIKAAIWSMVEDSGGDTPTEPALQEVYQHTMSLEDENKRMKRDTSFFVCITDGQSNTGPDYSKTMVKALQENAKTNKKNVVFIFIGVGMGTEFVNDINPPIPERLKQKMATELEKIRGTSVDPNEVSFSFKNESELSAVYPIIAGEMMIHPKSFLPQIET